MQAKKREGVNVDRLVLGMAGSFVLLSVMLGLIWTPWAFGFTLFVGANLLQSAFTGFCPAAIVMRKCGVKGGSAFSGCEAGGQ